ncbi:MAG: hypothetical protein RIQ93_1371 [Verrucomicrobiota bacterium]|jgi:hypothetical protein
MKIPLKFAGCAALGVLAAFAWSACSKPLSLPPDEAEPASFALRVTVPDGGWRFRVERVIEFKEEIWILAQLSRELGPGVQMIQEVEAAVPVPVPNKAVRVFVAGKTWAWENTESHEFVASLDSVLRKAGSGRTIYPPGAK